MQTGMSKTEITKFSFFSKSAQITILIEISEEMYMFDENGVMFSEKCVYFLKSYFERC